MSETLLEPARGSAPVGVFDSGLGGLSVLRELKRTLPAERFIYVADSGHCPYGGKSVQAIRERACVLTEFLLARGVKLIVVACNTATVAAVEYLRANYPVPFVGMEPAIKPAAAITRSGVIGVLSTAQTAAGVRLQRLIRQHANGLKVLTQPCPGLVERVEAGELDGAQTRAALEAYLRPLLEQGADTVVLGCTHYPFLRPLIADVAGANVNILDTGTAVARRCAALLEQEKLLATDSAVDTVEWFTTGDVAQLQRVGSRLWGEPIRGQALPMS